MRNRWTVNISPPERAARIGLGLAGVIGAALLLLGSSGSVTLLLAVLLGAAGLDLMVTGALGHCPLYAKLGHVPASLRRS